MGIIDLFLDNCLSFLRKYEPILNPHYSIMKTIETQPQNKSIMKTPEETFYRNIGIIRYAEKTLDYAFIDEKDALEIKSRLSYISELFTIYASPEILTD